MAGLLYDAVCNNANLRGISPDQWTGLRQLTVLDVTDTVMEILESAGSIEASNVPTAPVGNNVWVEYTRETEKVSFTTGSVWHNVTLMCPALLEDRLTDSVWMVRSVLRTNRSRDHGFMVGRVMWDINVRFFRFNKDFSQLTGSLCKPWSEVANGKCVYGIEVGQVTFYDKLGSIIIPLLAFGMLTARNVYLQQVDRPGERVASKNKHTAPYKRSFHILKLPLSANRPILTVQERESRIGRALHKVRSFMRQLTHARYLNPGYVLVREHFRGTPENGIVDKYYATGSE